VKEYNPTQSRKGKKHAKPAEREFKTSAPSAKNLCAFCVKEYNPTQSRKGKNTQSPLRENLKPLRPLRKTFALSV
jgi:hypothetical protein